MHIKNHKPTSAQGSKHDDKASDASAESDTLEQLHLNLTQPTEKGFGQIG